MKIYIVTYIDVHYKYNDGRPDVSVFASKRDAEVEYLGLIDPDLATAYQRWTDDHEEDARELAEAAMKHLEKGVYFDDNCTISIDEKKAIA